MKISQYDELTTRNGSSELVLALYGENYRQSADNFLAGMASEAYVTSAIAGGLASGNYLIDGGGVSWQGDYDYHISAATYVIQGVQYSSSPDDMTLSASDPTDDRIDIIAVDDTGSVVLIAGTPSATPQAPDVDPDTQLQLTFIYVPAGSTEPDNENQDIYLEHTEWTYVDNTANFDPDSTADPYEGTKSIEATNADAGNNLTLTYPLSGSLDLNTYNNLVFWLKPKATWPGAKNLRVFWLNEAGAQIGSQVAVKEATFGFVTSAATYQSIVIPIINFATTGQTAKKLRIRVAGGGATIGFFIDAITLQAGVAPNNAAGAMQYIGDWSSATAYSPQQVVRNGGYLYVAITASQNSTPLANDGNAAWKMIGVTLQTTTVGSNVFTLTNPSAIRYVRINADNTVTAISAATLASELQADVKPTESFIVAVGDEVTAVTTGTGKVTFRMPYAFTLTDIRSSVVTAPTGATLIVDVNEAGSTILSTKLSIDATEKTSTTAASAAVISDSALADDAEITIDIDQIGSTIAGAGLKVTLIGHR